MKKILFFALFLVSTLPLHKAFGQITFATRMVKDSLFIPWEIIYGPDDHIWFTQKNGYVCRLDPESGQLDTIYHESQVVVNNEGGMLGMAIHPDFVNDPYVFIAYEYMDGSAYKERIVKYTYNAGTLINPQILLDDITGASIHNGCRLAIQDDKLFISTGDASNTANSQNVNSINGKILRINQDGSIPADNPIAGSPVWSWGHRNAQGLVFHNGVLYSSEHGPDNDDEVNIILKGRNFGWPNVQGFCNTSSEMQYCADSNIVEPLQAWSPTLAVSGMEYYNHPMFPALANSLLLTTLKDNNLYQLQLNAAGDSVVNEVNIPGVDYGRLRDIAISPDGRIFLSTSNSVAGGTGAKIDKIIELYDSTITTGIYTQNPDNSSVILYPNPATDMVSIAFLDRAMGNDAWSYSITSLNGLMVQEGQLEFNKLHVGTLSPGLFFLRMTNAKNELIFKRLVKW
jgi:glucose/arabinose dehydrogenase